jgi:hypothetical protein
MIVHQVLTHLIHTFTHPITHISPLGGRDNSLSCLASTANVGNQQQPRGREEMTSVTDEGNVGHRNVHIYGHGYMYRSINSAERVHLEPQDHHHRWWPTSRLISGYLPIDMMPPYHSALSHPRVHRHAKTMRRSTEPSRSLRCLRRVWAIRPYLPTLSPTS